MKTINDGNNKLNFIGKIKASFSGRKFRSGAYSTILAVVVIVIVMVVNLIITKMNIQIDLTADSKFSITKETKNMIKGLKDDITIYYMIQQGSEVSDFEKIAQQYDKLSDKITLVNKDPILYPNFGAEYVDDTIANDSFLVVDKTNNRAKYIDESEMVVQETDYQTYQSYVTGTDAEGKLTSAILYVTSEDLPKMYVVQGHGETDIPTSFNDSMNKMNVETQTLSTMTQSIIPKDCDMLYINSPKSDFSIEETKLIKDYLAAGGNAIITTDYNTSTLTNFVSILDYYGIKVANGVVLEGDLNMHISSYPNYLLPTIESHAITTTVNNSGIPVVMLNSAGLTISDTKRSSLAVEPLLTTSDSAYAKTDLQSATMEKESGDIDGPFNLGLVATDTYNGITSKVIVYSSEFTFSDETSAYGNVDLLSGTIGFLSGNAATLSIPVKSYGGKYIVSSSAQGLAWGAVATFIIPIIIFATGAVICFKRRKK